MKYGETLRQRSIPEWSHYNVDYDVIKGLIKEHTTPGAGKAVSIPGQGDAVETDFENRLYSLLLEEHDRVNLFVKSKTGEIERRLNHLAKQIAHLEAWERPAAPSRNPPRRLERYARLDKETLQTGQEINSLSRFVNAQKLAFRKLIKKYKKWTGSETLGSRFTKEVSSSSDSFWALEVEPLFDQYTALLHVVRAAFEGDGVRSPSPGFGFAGAAGQPASVATQIRSLLQNGDHVDFDAAFASLPPGVGGGTAAYWIHPDCLIELQVLLLQYAQLHAPATSTLRTPPFGSSRSGSPTSRLRRNNSDVRADHFGQLVKDDEIGVLVIDDLQRFISSSGDNAISHAQSAFESRAGISADARWTAVGEAIVTVGQIPHSQNGPATAMRAARLKRKHLKNFFDIERPFNSRSLSSSSLAGPDAPLSIVPNPESIDSVRHWLTQNSTVKPLSGICAKRSRFVGLSNNSLRGVWAVLDREITMTKKMLENCGETDWVAAVRRDGVSFPYAVLQVRHEGPASRNLVQLLDASHLTERVRDFSLEKHCIWECCKPDEKAPPSWLAQMDKDIRKVPKPARRPLRRTSTISSQIEQSQLDGGSTTAGSTTDGYTSASTLGITVSSNTSILEHSDAPGSGRLEKGKGKLVAGALRRQDSAAGSEIRYWSEYDHPEDGDDKDAYYIYVDPNTPVAFPGVETAKKLFHKIASIFHPRPSTTERSPLLPQTRPRAYSLPADNSDSDSTSDEDGDAPWPTNPRHTTYGAISRQSDNASPSRAQTLMAAIFPQKPQDFADPALDQHHHRRRHPAGLDPSELSEHDHGREATKRRLYVTSLGAALVVLVFIALLRATGKKSLRGEVEAGMVFGIAADLAFALAGVAYLLSRREKVEWFERIAVWFVFVVVCLGDGGLVASMVT